MNGQGHNSAAYGQELGFDFFEMFDTIINTIGMTSAEKLAQIIIARKSHAVGGGTVAPSRTELTRQASCSEATLKRSLLLLETFFIVNKRDGKTTEYTPKPVVTRNDIADALAQMKRPEGVHHEPGSLAKGGHSEPGSHRAGVHHARDSVSRGAPSAGLSEPGQKRNSPTPPKEKTTTFKTNNHPSLETAGVVEVQGLNGATAHIVKTLGEWINPIMPDRKTAHGWLESSVSMYGGSIVRDSFAELESKILHGDIVARPIPLLTKICQRRAAAKPGNSRDPTEKPAGMPEKLWREIQAGKAKAPA